MSTSLTPSLSPGNGSPWTFRVRDPNLRPNEWV